MPLIAPSRRLLAAAMACAFVLVPATSSAQEATPEPSLSAAPSDAPAAVATSPEGSWAVFAYDAWEQGLAEPLPGSSLTLALLADGRLEGETACGRFDGGWFQEGEELSVGVAPSGNLGCGEQQLAEAIGLSTALGAATRWQAAATGLELLDATGATRVVLEALKIGDPAGEWSVARYRRPNGNLVEPLPDGPMSLTLVEDGSLEGSTGCRLLLGEYRYQGSGMTVGPLEAEGLPCDGDAARAERQFLRALGESVYWEQEGDALTLLDGFDEPVVELMRAAEAED